MQQAQHIKISELSSYAGIPASTIRYYVREGLLPEPLRTSKNMAYYSQAHWDRLAEIRKMQTTGLSLKSIKEKLANLIPANTSIQDDTTLYSTKRARIIESATALFRAKGYHTSIADIVEHAGIGKGTFYQYFNNKEDLFLECADSIFYDIDQEFKELLDEADVMQRFWNRALFLGRSYRHFIDMLNLTRGASVKDNPRFQHKLAQVMENMIDPVRRDAEIGIRQGLFRLDNSTIIAYLLLGAIEYGFYYFNTHSVNIEDLVTKGWDIIFNGMFADDRHTSPTGHGIK
jgi:AcrR family transcriptional regulator